MDRYNMAMLELIADVLAGYGVEVESPMKPSDLYSLAFPDVPIQRHFNTIRSEIEAKYQNRTGMLNRIQPAPVCNAALDKAQEEENVAKTIFHTWVELEKLLAVVLAASYALLVFMGVMLAFPVSIENRVLFLKMLTFGIMPWIIFGGSLIAAVAAMFIGEI